MSEHAAVPDSAAKRAPLDSLADRHARDRIERDLDASLIIEAAAGTGKTTALVSRIVALVAAGRTTLDRMAAVTYTDKAAGELKLRLRADIERARCDPARPASERQRLEQSLPHLEQARIGTIHSFCGDLLGERPVEAGIDPRFRIAATDLAGSLLERAFDSWYEAALDNPGPALRRILRRREAADRQGPRATLLATARTLAEWRDFTAPWELTEFGRDAETDRLIELAAKLGELAEGSDENDYLGKSLHEIRRQIHEATRLEAVRGRDYDALEAALVGLLDGRHWGWRGRRGTRYGGVERDEVVRRRAALREDLGEFQQRAGEYLAPRLRLELLPVVARYTDLKRRAGVLDFIDLLVCVRNLLRDDDATRGELQERFSHLFVDEFQDTDPLQVEILMLLAADNPAERDWRRVRPRAGKLFIVGDPKQSIYRFRRADLALYQAVKRQLIDGGAALEHLSVSFRPTGELGAMVNAAFATAMAGSETQASYSPLAPVRAPRTEQPAIVVLPVPAPFSRYDGKTLRKEAIEESLPDATAAFVHWLVEKSGWRVTEREQPARWVPIRPDHVCILFRRFNSYKKDVARDYMRALEGRRIPHVLLGGGSFYRREEVMALRNALAAIERPEDELAVFATLRGPMFALSDGALLNFRESVGSLHPFRRLPEEPTPQVDEVGAALKVLRDLHRGRNRRPLAATIEALLTAVRATAGFAIWPTGEQALANLIRLMDKARRYEQRGGAVSFRGFLEQLEDEAERGDVHEAKVVEEGTEGVRMMTVHAAKGLEFPVVVLADLTCNETRAAQRWVEPQSGLCALTLAGCAPRELNANREEEERRDREEAVRLLYVAATRARDLLVVPALSEAPGAGALDQRGWLDKLAPAIYPDESLHKGWRLSLDAQPPGCPRFGEDCLVGRLDAATLERSVAPGLHRPQRGDHRVVWWEAGQLTLDVRESMGLRQFRLLEADQSRQISTRGQADYERWRTERIETRARATHPSLRIATVSEMALDAARNGSPSIEIDAGEISVEEAAGRDPNRPRGARFGSLVHDLMLAVAFDDRRPAIVEAARLRGRILGAGEGEVAAAIEAVAQALSTAVIGAAHRAKDRCRRECPLLWRERDGELVEGIADLAFAETLGRATLWTVVEFKTDLEPSVHMVQYRRQLALYMRAVAAATGCVTRGVLLLL